jgi:hypothetical protein
MIQNHMKRILVLLLIGMSAGLGCYRSSEWNDQATDAERDRSTARDVDGDTGADLDTDADADADADADTDADTDTDRDTDALEGCSGPIDFPDDELREKVREAIGMPTGDIFSSDVDDLVELTGGPGDISDLTGIQCLTNLTHLDLWDNSIGDISALAGLTNMTHLDLHKNSVDCDDPVTQDQIATLEERVSDFTHDCH